MFSMSRQTTIIGVTIIVTLLAMLLASQPQLIDSLLMHRFVPQSAQSYFGAAKQARRVFTPYRPSTSTFTTTTISMASDSIDNTANRASDINIDPQDPTKDNEGQPLGLPPPPSEDEARKLDMSSGEASVKMDHLGPLVVNKDGTLSRTGNWEQMTEIEKKNTLRILGKRNQLRTEALKAGEAQEGTK